MSEDVLSLEQDPEIRELIVRALAEDVGSGDATTLALVDADATASARIVARHEVVPAGLAIAAGLALTSLAERIARYSKTPHLRVIETMIIMPTSRPMVLKSIPAMACSWVSKPDPIISIAPRSAMIDRFSRSLMITA